MLAASTVNRKTSNKSFGEHMQKLQDMRMPQTADLQHLRHS